MQRVKLPIKLLRHNAIRALLELVALPDVRVFLVGGTVRDLMLGKSLADIDVVVTGIPYKKLGALLAKRGTVQTVGDFGTLKFTAEGEYRPVDVALPRTERSDTTGARTGFAVKFDETLPIEDDLGRRDFTVNAMAIDLVSKELIDPFHGTADLAERIIHAVGNPVERFSEDYSRLLRAFRFACELQADIALSTRKALRASVLKLAENIVPAEMIASELTKALVADPVRFMDLMEPTGIGRVLLPELLALREVKASSGAPNGFLHTQQVLAASQSEHYRKKFGERENDPTVLFALLFHDIGKAKTGRQRRSRGTMVTSFNRHAERGADIVHVIWERLKLAQSGANRTAILTAVANHMVIERADIGQIRNQTLDQYFLAHPAEGLVLKKVIWCDGEVGDTSRKKTRHAVFQRLEQRLQNIAERAYKNGKPVSLLTGTDVMNEFHIPAGEELGAILTDLRLQHLEGIITTPEDARAYIQTQYRYAHAPGS